MHMKDYLNQLDKILLSLEASVLTNAGSVSHKDAIEKAKLEYKKYQVKELSPIEKEYLKSINDINNLTHDISKGVK